MLLVLKLGEVETNVVKIGTPSLILIQISNICPKINVQKNKNNYNLKIIITRFRRIFRIRNHI